MYMRGQDDGPIATHWIPYENEGNVDDGGRPFRYWSAICYNGKATDKINVVNKLTNEKPSLKDCLRFY